MKYADINKRYTEIINKYLVKGYTVNTATMGGSQGEIAHIDLTDGNEIIRILVEGFNEYHRDIEGVEIIVGKATDEIKPNSKKTLGTIWNNRLEIIESERFFAIGRNGYYTDKKEEAERAAQKRMSRYDTTPRETYEPSAKAIEIAKKVIRKKFDVKRINTAEVKLSKYGNEYTVKYRNNIYRLR